MPGPKMACGHFADVEQGTGLPAHDPCVGFNELSVVVKIEPLTERIARCACGRFTNSGPRRPMFFRHQPDKAYDFWYCGHGGWR